MVLDASLINTQHYKVRIKGKVEQSRERISAPPLHIGVVAIEKGAFGLPSTMVANFTLLTLYICYKTRSCLDLKKQKERKEEKKKKTEVNTSSSQLKMKS